MTKQKNSITPIEIIVIGPEQPLVDGIVDHLEEKKIKVYYKK